MKKIGTIIFAIVALNTGTMFNCFGQAGSLDLTFSTDGIATDVAGYGKCVAIQTDGKILVGGFNNGLTDIVVSRYNTNGTLDLTFDADGIVSVPIPVPFSSTKLSMDLQSDGKIVLASTTTSGSYDVVVFRLSTTGALDNTFGTLGVVVTPVGSGADMTGAMKIQSDGKIVVAGVTHNGSNNDILVIRYNSDGTLDTGFDADGILVNTTYPFVNDRGTGVAIQTDGKIVVGGYYNGTNNPLIVRYNADGTFDTSFGSGGVFTSSLNQTLTSDIAIQSDGKIVMSASGSDDFKVLRCNSNGTIDTGFGTSGVGTASFTASPDQDNGFSMAIQSDGKIVLAGRAGLSTSSIALARFTTTGILDVLFDTDGLVTSLTGSSAAYDVAIQTDGKIVVVGEDFVSGYVMVAARYFGLCPFPSNPGSITGNTSPCTGSTNTYSISSVSGATSYSWAVPSGAVINSGQGTTSISVTFASTSGNVTVTPQNACGSSSTQSLAISLTTVLAMPGTITGSTSVCAGSTNTYSISSMAGATGYTWTVPFGSTINSGQGTTSISVTAGATPGTMTVTAENACGSSPQRTLSITNPAPSQPGPITGTITFCFGTTQTYSISSVSGATSYTWSVPADATINSGQGTTSVSVTFGTTSGPISVTSDNVCGSSTPRVLNLTVINLPATPGTITGDFSVCPSTSNPYSIAAVSGATSYTWMVPSDAVINSGQGTTAINVTLGSSSGDIVVIAENSCGSSGWQYSPITVETPYAFFSWSAVNLAVTFTNLSQNTNSYAWAFGDAGTSSAPNPVHNYGASGTYTVELTATGACGSSYYTTNITITDSTSGGDVGVEEIQKSLSLNVYPNPSSGKIQLDISGELIPNNHNYTIEIINLIGESMGIFKVDGEHAEIDLSKYSDGVYYLKCVAEHAHGIVKVIKQ